MINNVNQKNLLVHNSFGMLMPDRSFSTGYRFGFNGKESDNEVSGNGNQYDYGFRIYNPRISKFLSVDPLTASYPMLTPYQFASNMPIAAIDIDGLEAHVVYIDHYFSATEPKVNVIFDEQLKEVAGDFAIVHRYFDSGNNLESATLGTGLFADYPQYFVKKATVELQDWNVDATAKLIGGTLAGKFKVAGEEAGGSIGIDATLVGYERENGKGSLLHPGNQTTIEPHAELELGVVGAKVRSQNSIHDLSTEKVSSEFGLGPASIKGSSDKPESFGVGIDILGAKISLGGGFDLSLGLTLEYKKTTTYTPNPSLTGNGSIPISDNSDNCKYTPSIDAKFD